MDIEGLSAAEIEALQEKLAEKLAEKQLQEKLELVKQLESMIEASEYEAGEIVSLLSQRVHRDQVKYRHPTDETKVWSGRGRMPQWLHDLINAGHSKEDFKM